METFNTLEKEWIGMLTDGDDTAVLTALHQVRNSGSIRILPYVIDLLQKPLKESMADHVLRFLGDIRMQEAAPLMMEALDAIEKGPYFSGYLSACWQSGLDFSAYIPRFTELFVRSDYQAALETFTLIEESVFNADEQMKLDCLRQLKDAGERIQKEKYPLYLELIRTISEA